MNNNIKHITLVVRDYDEAIEFYVNRLDFELVEDTRRSETKRWVVVKPKGSADFSLLLAKAKNQAQEAAIGNQTGGRMFLFLHTDNIEAYLAHLEKNKVNIIKPLASHAHGKVIIFKDLYGNMWDLIEPNFPKTSNSIKHSALLNIDMQKGSFTEETPRFDTGGTVSRMNQTAKVFRSLELPVVYIQHDGAGTGEYLKQTEEWELLDDLEVQPADILIDKYANDVFYNSKLQETLIRLGVNHLVITGCATDFCVEATVQSAIAKDFHVTVMSDGHTTGERPHMSAEQTISHYNWVWQHMIPTKGSISVKSCDEILKELV